MVKFPEAQSRMQRNMFVCQRCKTKVRASSAKITEGKVKCRRCNSKMLRPVRKK
ncbi:MAG TPA: hypothetical protein VJI75_01280 [Candidatus Nanoarchaeia archaeon]|nr:hypothetical protein [Candidatus Nanoarchaeia archaeon]